MAQTSTVSRKTLLCAAVMSAALPVGPGGIAAMAAVAATGFGAPMRVNVTEVGAAREWSRVRNTLRGFGKLPRNWDGEGTPPPSNIQAVEALRFLDRVEQVVSTAPVPYIDGASEIGMRWTKGDGYGSVAFMDDGHIVGFVRAPGEQTAFKLDKPIKTADLEPLLTALRALA
jgi:hypothetical protein